MDAHRALGPVPSTLCAPSVKSRVLPIPQIGKLRLRSFIFLLKVSISHTSELRSNLGLESWQEGSDHGWVVIIDGCPHLTSMVTPPPSVPQVGLPPSSSEASP